MELACATGQSKIANYLLKDLYLVSSRDLKLSKPVDERMYLYVPMLKKDLAVWDIVLQYVPLTRQDVKDLMWILKQVQWTEGIEALLSSRAC